MPVFGLECEMETSDAAGCNWVSFNTMSTHTIEDILPKALMEKYPSMGCAGKKQAAFCEAKMQVIGNNSKCKSCFQRQKKH